MANSISSCYSQLRLYSGKEKAKKLPKMKFNEIEAWKFRR